MSSSPFITLSSPLSDPGALDYSAAGPFMDSLLKAPMRPASLAPVAIKSEVNPPQVPLPVQVSKNTGSKSRSKSNPNPAEVFSRRRSTRVSMVPSRFQPEVKSYRPANNPEGESSDTRKNTPTATATVISTGDISVTPAPKVRAANSGRSLTVNISPFEENTILSGPEIVGEEVSLVKEIASEDSTEAVLLKKGRGQRLGQENQDTPMAEDSIIKASPPSKRSNQKKKPMPRKPKTSVTKITTPRENDISSPSSNTSTRTRKRLPSEELAKHLPKKVKSEHRASLVVETSTRRTRSQNASAPDEPVGTSRPTEIKPPRKPATKASRIKSSATEITCVPPRLSATHFAAPLREMIRSAVLYYSTLPTNLTDGDAVANIYRTFCALGTYREHLKVMGLEGDDRDVRGVMSQVWQLVDKGERDEEVVWKILIATWNSQGASGWGNGGKV